MKKNKNLLYISIILIVLIVLLFIYNFKSSYEGFEDNPEIDYILPKTIWSYWDTEELPPLIKNIKDYNKAKLTEYKYIWLNNNNLDKYISKESFPKGYDQLGIAHKTDWIRLYLLKKYGGLWLDASIIINNVIAIDNLYNESIVNKSEFTGFFYANKIRDNDETTYIENWFILSPINSRLIDAWFNEFNSAVIIGFTNYRNIYLKGKKIILDNIYSDSDKGDIYLTMHASLQKILQLKEISNPRLLLKNANETMFKLHSQCNWNHKCVMNTIKNDSKVKDIPYIKLIGSDRSTNIDISEYFIDEKGVTDVHLSKDEKK